jgi:hypothetical protein
VRIASRHTGSYTGTPVCDDAGAKHLLAAKGTRDVGVCGSHRDAGGTMSKDDVCGQLATCSRVHEFSGAYNLQQHDACGAG